MKMGAVLESQFKAHPQKQKSPGAKAMGTAAENLCLRTEAFRISSMQAGDWRRLCQIGMPHPPAPTPSLHQRFSRLSFCFSVSLLSFFFTISSFHHIKVLNWANHRPLSRCGGVRWARIPGAPDSDRPYSEPWVSSASSRRGPEPTTPTSCRSRERPTIPPPGLFHPSEVYFMTQGHARTCTSTPRTAY